MRSDGQPGTNRDVHPFFHHVGGDPHTSKVREKRTNSAHDVPIPQSESTGGKAGELSNERQMIQDGSGEMVVKPKKQKTLGEIVNLRSAQAEPAEERKEPVDLLSSQPASPDQARRKRRKTDEREAVEVGSEALILIRRPSSPCVIIPASSPLQNTKVSYAVEPSTPDNVQDTPPKKMLRLGACGKFSSPPTRSKKEISKLESVEATTAARTGGESITGNPRSLVVRIQYGQNPDKKNRISARVVAILSGADRVHVVQPGKRSAKRKKKTEKRGDAPARNATMTVQDTVQLDGNNKDASAKRQRTPRKTRSTHPFFLGKPMADVQSPVHQPSKKITANQTPRKTSAVTPGKLRMQAAIDRPHELKELPYAVGSSLLKDRLMVKHPGAIESPWPNREQAHVRGLQMSDRADIEIARIEIGKGKGRKAALLPISPEESILQLYSPPLLRTEGEGILRDDGYNDPHPSLSVPTRLLITGHEIAARVLPELSRHPACPGSLDTLNLSQSWDHLVLNKLWKNLPCAMTAFDENKGEAMSWAHKYAPTSSAEVLQPNREMGVLKAWLLSLTVTAVGGISKVDSKLASRSEPKPKKKRKRKNGDLDDFLVDDDEELHDMDQLTDLDQISASTGVDEPKSVVQVISSGAKLTNVVLLSGPHGCGKTAAAHAVAKELGFKVFEISSSERRAGRDVLDKVGDMTENHLVRHHGSTDPGELSSGEEPSHMNEAFERDLASGRQGKMNTFFKLKSQPTEHALQKQVVQAKVLHSLQKAAKKPQKDQQQSLILLEEVDVLFKEDKEFWSTVLKLIITSKRPFILTCNDEDLIPTQSMAMHAILRFTPAAIHLAVDYMLLIAATEGHLLKRDAVLSLYETQHHDLRASIAELDFWCQMGVGDPKSGLSWIYQRWPPGLDTDETGRKLRVVSEGTYLRNMGTVSESGRDVHDSMLWCSQELQIEAHELLGWHDLNGTEWLDESIGPVSTKQRHRALKSFTDFADVLSDMDVYAGVGRQDGNDSALDTTQPELPQKTRNHYTEGMALLQTDEAIDPYFFQDQLAIATTLAAYEHAGLKCARNFNTTRAAMQPLSRKAFAVFDPIATPENNMYNLGLQRSAFDGPLASIVTDLAPYVRNIVHHDLERERLFAGEGTGGNVKKLRTTRAARSAMNAFGLGRSDVRKAKWFSKDLDLRRVMATGGQDWQDRRVRPGSDSTTTGDFDDEVGGGGGTPVSTCGF